MSDIVRKDATTLALNIQKVEDKIAVIRSVEVIADADVADLYGVQTKRVNEAVRNNPDKFPARYMFELSKSELRDLRSKISTTNVSQKSRSTTKVFTGDKFLHWQAEAHSKTRATGGKRVISQLKHLYMMRFALIW
jgi:hypothetical protein